MRLSEKELRILEYLIANQGHILTREQLAAKIWGYDNEAEYNNVEVYMCFARKVELCRLKSGDQGYTRCGIRIEGRPCLTNPDGKS